MGALLYLTTCPNCGRELFPIAVVGGGSPPFGCADCSRGWWTEELTPRARRSWDPLSRSFTDPQIEENAAVEHMESNLRGTSVIPDTAVRLPDEVLTSLQRSSVVSQGTRELFGQIKTSRKKVP